MASILKVDTLTGVTTAGSISVTGEGNSTTTNLQQGLAKAWANLNGTGTIALQDSFNCASAVDNGTGSYTYNWSSSLGNATYAGTCLSQGGGTSNTACYNNLYFGGMATGSLRVNHFNQAAPGVADTANISVSADGDLA